MAHQHLERLTSTDASFLHRESASAHMHVGGVLLFEGKAPPIEAVLDHIRSRLHLVPRYRQKLAFPPAGSGRPLWIDDQSFNLGYHVRHTALPAPGSEAQLLALTGRLASQPLDRSKPLWEFWLVEGIEPAPGASGERFAMIAKSHHALVDGISGIDLATVLLDLSPEPQRPDTSGLEPWQPRPTPTAAQMVAVGLRDGAGALAGLAARALAAAASPGRSAQGLRDSAEGVGDLLWQLLDPAPATPLNVPIGPHRRFRVVRQQLSDYKAVKDACGATVNDVVLAVVAGAVGDWMRAREIDTSDATLRALVPVSVRSAQERGTLGNRLTVMRGPLPVGIRDPLARLRAVAKAMDAVKRSKQAVGASALVAAGAAAPPAVLAQASRLQFSTRLFNLLVTNVPGPQVPLYILGRRLSDLFPLAFLPDGHALAVALMSYNGKVEYGLLGDYDALADIDLIASGLDRSLAELVRAVRGPAGADSATPAPLLPASRRRAAGGPAAEMRARAQRPKRAGLGVAQAGYREAQPDI